MKWSRINIFLILCLVGSQISAQETYEINTQYPVHNLLPHIQIIADTSNSYPPERLLNDSTLQFSTPDEFVRGMAIGLTYWGKITILSKKNLEEWTLHFQDNLRGTPAWTKSNGKVDIYAYSNGKRIFHKKTGVEFPKKQRDIKQNWVLNRISLSSLPVNTPVTLVMRIEGNSLGFPAYFNTTIRSPDQGYYHEIFEFNNAFNLFMFGVTFIIFLYHLLQFFYLRQRIFLWFSIWLFFCTLTMAMSVGWFIGDIYKYRLPVWMLIANGVLYSFWFFGRSFINSKEKFPKLDKVILGLSIAMILEIIIMALYVILFNPQPYVTGVGIHYKMIILYSAISIVISIILMLKKDQFARYFGFGASIVSVAFIVGGLWSEGVLRPPFDPYAWGMFLQIVIYSFGIAYRQQTLSKRTQKEKLEAQKAYAEMQHIKDLDEIKTRFYANISHEFRTPLSLISEPLKLAKKAGNPDEDEIMISSKTFNLINNNANRLQSLIDQLLELSIIESGNIQLNLVSGGLIKLIKAITFSFESMSESKSISLNTSFPKENQAAFYDKDKLEKIVSNLLSNAFKYTPSGGAVTVTIDYNESHYIIEISDTGKGMTNEEVKHIFERFYRVQGSEEKGSGIGLALTKEMVDVQNGQISVRSRKGEGTIFKVRIPHTLQLLPGNISTFRKKGEIQSFEKNILEQSDLKNTDKSDNESIIHPRHEHVVLVVEDNDDLRSFICDVLKDHYKVITANDGFMGERMAFEHIPDIVLSDIMMPKMDGYQLSHSLKTNPKTSHIPIIMLTAKVGQENKMEGLTQGADAYVSKPFKSEELLLRIKNLIQTRKKIWEHFQSLDLAVIGDLDVTSVDDKFLQNVVGFIKTNLDNEHLSVQDLAREIGFSRAQLHRKIKALTNKSANQLIIEMRLNEAKRRLQHKTGSVSEIAFSVGYSNMSHFSKSFKEKFGVLPSKIIT